MSEIRSIVQVSVSRAWGGLEMTAVRFAEHFKHQGWNSYAICPESSPAARELEKRGLEICPIPQGGHFAPTSSLAVRRFIKQKNINVVVTHVLRDLWILWPALWQLPEVRLIGVAHMFLRGVNKKDFLHRQMYGRLDRMIALNEAQKAGLMQCLPVAPERYSIIPHGVDIERFNPSRRSETLRREVFGVAPTERAVGVIGRLDPQKGQREFLEAAALVHKRFPTAHFIVIGSETVEQHGYIDELHRVVRENGLEGRVKFLGHRQDTPEILASLDVFVLPSYEEAFGLVTVEAMASGCSIVATRSGGTPEIINDGQCGVLVPPKDSPSLADALARYLGDGKLACAHAQAARQRAEAEFDQRRQLAQVEALVTSCLK